MGRRVKDPSFCDQDFAWRFAFSTVFMDRDYRSSPVASGRCAPARDVFLLAVRIIGGFSGAAPRHNRAVSIRFPLRSRISAISFAAALALAAALPDALAAESKAVSNPADSMRQRVEPCFACHGQQGRAGPDGYYPRIAGKPAGYLFEQLLNFRDGRRNYAMMTYMVGRKSEAYLREMADYFSSLELPYAPPIPAPRNPSILDQGETLVRSGDRERDIPACAACHGQALTGVAPAVPSLLGLPRDYLVAQLGAWREGSRKARAPDCMQQIATRLSGEEVDALVSWLSSQPVPANARAPSIALKAPLRCGSLEPRR